MHDYQADGLEALVGNGRLAVRSPHGVGKTTLAAWALLWFALTRDGDVDWKIPVTASNWRQVKNYLWPEVHKWVRRIRWDVVGRTPFVEGQELLALNLNLNTGSAFGMVSSDPAFLEGAHATSLFFIYDEAKAIPVPFWDAAEGAFTGGSDEILVLAISTPGDEQGRFYDIHARKQGYEDWATFHISKDMAIASGQMSREWAQQRERQWGKDSAVYQNRVEGNFADSAEDSVIPLAWVELAISRWHDWQDRGGEYEKFTGTGVDVSLGQPNSDEIIFAMCYDDYKIGSLDVMNRGDIDTMLMQVAGRVVALYEAKGGIASVDVIGIGAGVVQRAKEQGVPVIGFNAAAGTKFKDQTDTWRFRNLRSAGWWMLRELLDPETGVDVALPDDPKLIGDLTTPKFRYTSGGRIEVESKEKIYERLRRSTDRADAAIHILCKQLVEQPKKKVVSGRLSG